MEKTDENEAACSCTEGSDDGDNEFGKNLRRVLTGAVIYAAAILSGLYSDAPAMLIVLLFLFAYFVIGGIIVKAAILNIFRGRVFDENFLMTVATAGAFFIGDYSEAVAVMLFFQVGELFQSYAVGKSRRSIAALMDIRPDYAYLKRGAEFIRVMPEEVAKGETIQVKPGEKIPLDGIITAGSSFVDTKALTGESIPREVYIGEPVISGSINLNGVIEIRTEKEYSEGTVKKILELVENAGSRKAPVEHFITKFARVYTPIVVGVAILLAILPPLVTGGDIKTWLYRALTFLVISCPCALVISIPLGFFGGIGGASRAGILVKGSNYLEALRNIETVVMDKTGTLTKGSFLVRKIIPAADKRFAGNDKILEIAAYAESFSSHPISKSLRLAYDKELMKERITDVEEIAGHGVKAVFDGRNVYVGNIKMMQRYGIHIEEMTDRVGQESSHESCQESNTKPGSILSNEAGTIIHVAYDEQYIGAILIADELKEDAKEAVEKLKAASIKVVMLTGDSNQVAAYVANELGIDEYYSELLPVDKVEIMERFLGKAAFVGDGINDAPVLARADVGIAMGGLGSDAAIEAADVVIMNDMPSKIHAAIKISKRTIKIVRENIVFALVIKTMVLILAAFGYATMWAAVFADVGVAFLAILNSMRVIKGDKAT